jgi:hypothetical protein
MMRIDPEKTRAAVEMLRIDFETPCAGVETSRIDLAVSSVEIEMKPARVETPGFDPGESCFRTDSQHFEAGAPSEA